MLPTSQLWEFLLTVYVVILIPGPSVLFVVSRGLAHTSLQLLTLGLICVVIAVLSDGAWAIASGSSRQWLGRSPRRLERLSASGGVMLIGRGVGLAVTGRRN